MMEKELWKEFPEKMAELERDREETMDLKLKMDRLEKKDGKSLGATGPLILTIYVFILLGGLLRWGLWGVLANLICVIFPLSIVEGACNQWWDKHVYFKNAPSLQEQLERAEERNKEKYKQGDWKNFDALISKKIFSAEAVQYISELIMQQQVYDMDLAVDIYCNSDDYRRNLVKMNSEKNIAFLEMLQEGK